MALLPAIFGRGRNNEMKQYDHHAGGFLFAGNRGVINFAVTGIGRRQAVVTELLRTVYGRVPVIVIHGYDDEMKSICEHGWQYAFNQEAVMPNGDKFWDCETMQFEPFYGMNAQMAWECLIELAPKSARENDFFDGVVEGYLELTEALESPISLTMLQYLSSVTSLAVLEENIAALPCSAMQKEALKEKLALKEADGRAARMIFHNLIRDLKGPASRSGWDSENAKNRRTGSMSITSALAEGASILIPVNTADNAQILMRYLCLELQKNSLKPFLLILDNVSLKDTGIEALLMEKAPRFRYGLIGSDLVEMVGGEETFRSIASCLQRIISFRAPTAPAAQPLSALMGEDYVQRQTITDTTDREWMGIFPDRRGHSTAIHIEKASRLEVQQLQSLRGDQVMVLDLLSGNFGSV